MGIGCLVGERKGDRIVFVDIDDSWGIILLLTVPKGGVEKSVLLLDLPVCDPFNRTNI